MSAPAGPIVYCTVELDVHHDDGAAYLVFLGCVVNPDGSLVVLDPGTESVQFLVVNKLAYGASAADLVTPVMDALEATYGITGLADVKFVPAF
jgi:hypothetical protein